MPFDKDRRNRLPSIQSKLRSIRGMEKDELQLFLRIGNLIDATVQAARGLANVGDQQSRTPAAGIPIPQNVKLTSALDGIDINFDPVDFDNLAHYEIDIDISSVFSAPVTRKAFTNKFVIRGLESGVFFVRIRVVDRTGKVGEYSDTEEVTIGAAGFKTDADFFLPEQRDNAAFNNETVSKDFFVNAGDNVLVGMGVSCLGGKRRLFVSGRPDIRWAGGSGDELFDVEVATLEEQDLLLESQGRGFGNEVIKGFFYTYQHLPGQGFDPFYIQPGFYHEPATAYVGGPSTYTMIHFFQVDQASASGNRHWDVTHGDFFDDGFYDTPNIEARSSISWMLQSVVKF